MSLNNTLWTVVLAWWPRLSIDRVDVNVINRDTRAAGPWLAGRAAFYGMHMLDSTAAAAATATAATRPRARSHLRSTHTQRALGSTSAAAALRQLLSKCIKRNPPPTKLNSNQQNLTRTRHKT